MGNLLFDRLLPHVGHRIVCVTYGEAINVAIECETCGTVLVDADSEVANA